MVQKTKELVQFLLWLPTLLKAFYFGNYAAKGHRSATAYMVAVLSAEMCHCEGYDAPAPCPECGQTPSGIGGEYPCKSCGIPTMHDAPEAPEPEKVAL